MLTCFMLMPKNSQVLIATSTAFEPSSYGLYARSGLLVGNFSGTGNGFTVRRGDTLKLNINHDSTKGFVTTGGSPLHFRTTENSNYKISMETDGVVINENGQDYDFRVESNGDDYAFFVDGGNDRVVVGSAGTDHANSKFVVVGRQTIYNGSSTGGSVLLTDGYSASTDDHLLNIGTQRSSGGPFISYGLGHDQNSDGLWKSTYDNFSGNHSVLVLNGATLEYHLDVSNSATTVGNTVALQNGYKVGRSAVPYSMMMAIQRLTSALSLTLTLVCCLLMVVITALVRGVVIRQRGLTGVFMLKDKQETLAQILILPQSLLPLVM